MQHLPQGKRNSSCKKVYHTNYFPVASVAGK
nr:MAG TPA: hypothetical protein [Caudoviricetes sp.]